MDVLLKLVIAFLLIEDYAINNKLVVRAHLEPEIAMEPLESRLTEIDTQLSSIRPRDTASSYADCYVEENCTGEQYCNVQTHQCQCFEATYVEGVCPTVGMHCTTCCCGQNVYCSSQFCEVYHVDQISSQMIMSIVMVMGIVSIVFMVYRMCYKNTMAQRILISTDESQRPSLSSLQVGVMARMRDRPPMYETRHNYEFRSHPSQAAAAANRGIDNRALEVTELAVERTAAESRPSVVSHPSPAMYADNTPPPPYNDDDVSTISGRSSNRCDQQLSPPPYSVAIKGAPPLAAESPRSRPIIPESSPPNELNYKELYI